MSAATATPARSFLTAFALVWLGLFALSVGFERPEFRPWEMLDDPDSPTFLPNRRVARDAIGDLGYASWVRALQVNRPAVFTTDAAGFRNRPMSRAPRVVVIGDSYVAGCGLSDEQTVTHQLSQLLGEPVYNYAMGSFRGPIDFLEDPRFQQTPPELVIYAPVSRHIKPLTGRPPAPEQSLVDRVEEQVSDVSTALERDNGLKRHARFWLNGLSYRVFGRDDVIFPDGEPALALSPHQQGLLAAPQERQLDAVVRSVLAVGGFLRQRGIRMVYSPIPESATIYPELFDGTGAGVEPSFLELLLARVRDGDMEVVDLRQAFRRARHPYLYLRDDSHWNARGAGVAARAWAEHAASHP